MSTTDNFQLAIKHQQAGNLQESIKICKKMLKKQPGNAKLLHYLGTVYNQLGNHDAAAATIKKALELNPKDPEAHNDLGIILQKAGNLDEAIASYRKAVQSNPNFAYAYYNLGIACKEKNNLEEAFDCFRKAVQCDPNFAYAYNNLGLILEIKGNLDEAIACFQKALQLDPVIPNTYYNLGRILKKRGELDKAMACFVKALKIDPQNAEAYNNLGRSLREKGDLDKAIACFQKALQINPDYVDACNNLGVSFQEIGQKDQAIAIFKKAIQLNPDFADAYNNLGISYFHKGQLGDAITCYQKALQLNPSMYTVFSNLGNVLKDKGQIDEAESLFRRAVYSTMDFSLAYSNLLLIMQYNIKHDAGAIYTEHRKFSEKYEKPLFSATAPHTNNRDVSRRLRVGYVSPDFRSHSVAHFIEPVLISHDREFAEVFCYSNSAVKDEVTERIQGHTDQWRNIVGMTDEEAAEHIRKDEIDILIDLAGHTAGGRLLMFARKPTPVQVSWIGYPATTGLSAIDYKIVDNYTDPPGMTEEFYTEILVRLPESYLCYLPDKDGPAVEKLPLSLKGHITFGSFNHYAKVSPEVVDVWTNILQSVPDSHLIMKAKSFIDSATCQHLQSIFEQKGITPDRIELLSWASSMREHLELYNRVDIGLDTFPYNGTTTTCESMWMGVPVITLAGNMHVSRVGVSLLSNVGLPELVAGTKDEYLSIAVNLAQDLQRLQFFRKNLREMMRRSPLCNTKRFTADLEKCYRMMWETWVNR
jgi:protein O-GlcNAc transferase